MTLSNAQKTKLTNIFIC